MHQVTTMLATLIIILAGVLAIIKVSGHQY